MGFSNASALIVIVAAAWALAASAVIAQTPVADLAKPPANATRYPVLSSAGRHGETAVWTARDGVRWSRESINLRGQIYETDQAATLRPDGAVSRLTVRGVTPGGDAAETFTIDGGKASWRSRVDFGTKAYAPGALYMAFGGTSDARILLFEALMAAPSHRAALIPSGEARLEPLTTAFVGSAAEKRTLTAWEIVGLDFSPIPVWADDKGRFFAELDPTGLSVMAPGHEADLAPLLAAQRAAAARRGPAVLASLLQPVAGPVVFAHVEMFDADAGVFRQDMTVIVEGEKIAFVGRAAPAVPNGARIIDGRGKALVPGLWDMHQHYGDDSSGPLLLSLGVTSVRDPGNNDAATLDRRTRRAAGELLSPNVYPSALLDGRSPYTAQVGTVVTSQEEALAAVDKARADEFTGIKIYGSFNPAWVTATAAEAHRLGLHVHGHVPAGMRPLDAVKRQL